MRNKGEFRVFTVGIWRFGERINGLRNKLRFFPLKIPLDLDGELDNGSCLFRNPKNPGLNQGTLRPGFFGFRKRQENDGKSGHDGKPGQSQYANIRCFPHFQTARL